MKTKLILGSVAVLALTAGLVSAAHVSAQVAPQTVTSSSALHQVSDGDGEQVDSSKAVGTEANDAEAQDDAARAADASDGEAADATETTAQ